MYLDSLIREKFICSCVVIIIGQAYNPIVLSHTTTYMMYILVQDLLFFLRFKE